MSPAQPRGLGRGLGALIPRNTGSGVAEIPLAQITPNPRQPRSHFDPDALDELARSIKEHGLLQPVVVSRQSDTSYQLIAGERRWRAVQMAGLPTIAAVVKEATPRSSLEMALVENIQRRDLNALEEAHAYRQLLDEHGLTHESLAERVGKSRTAVTNTLRLLGLSQPAQMALVDGRLSEGHARALLGAPDQAAQVALLDRVLTQGLSVRQTEAAVRSLSEEPAAPEAVRTPTPDAQPEPDVERIENAFRQALGTRVQLVRSRKGGKLVIHFFSDDELRGLYETIVRESMED